MKRIMVDRRKESGILKGRMASPIDPGGIAARKAFEPVVRRAIEVIGDEQKALRWLGTPVRALNYATPISLLSTESGKNAVLLVLHNLEHGLI